VEQEAELGGGIVGQTHVHLPDDLHPVGGHTFGVLGGVAVSRLHGVGQRGDPWPGRP
jgi:hypothetical protein